jgi:hypothetical protein
MGALEGSRVQVQADQMKEALVCRESCAADARQRSTSRKTRRSLFSPKSEQQPNAPGLLFWFLLHVEGKSPPIARYVLKAGKIAQRVLDQRHGLMFRSLSGQPLLLLAEEKPVHFPLFWFSLWRFTPSGGIPGLNNHSPLLSKGRIVWLFEL